MTVHYADDWLTVYLGDCRQVMAEMEPESVHCVVTSPPYWGLRDYGTATWEGGDEGCDHAQQRNVGSSTLRDDGRKNIGTQPYEKTAATVVPFKDTCRKCGAHRVDSQLGLEPTPEQYVENMVAVFREVRRVLRSDGTVWLNLGDSYAHNTKEYPPNRGIAAAQERLDGNKRNPANSRRQNGDIKAYTSDRDHGLKPKDLVGIPWRVAFALQADGWYLRSDIIWAKPNPMPESVTDRPTKAHEYLFLLSKSPRYYYDADAVREASSETPGAQAWRRIFDPSKQRSQSEPSPHGGGAPGPRAVDPAGRNLRSVWNIATQPYPGAHFATFPRALVEPCIKAGSPEGGVVLDPFAGSGTTGLVAQRLSRRAVLIDLNGEYLEQAMERNRDIPMGLANA